MPQSRRKVESVWATMADRPLVYCLRRLPQGIAQPQMQAIVPRHLRLALGLRAQRLEPRARVSTVRPVLQPGTGVGLAGTRIGSQGPGAQEALPGVRSVQEEKPARRESMGSRARQALRVWKATDEQWEPMAYE